MFRVSNQNYIYLIFVCLVSIVSIHSSDSVVQNIHEQNIVLNSNRFENLFMSEDLDVIMQDSRWKEYAVYAHMNRNRFLHASSLRMTQSQIDKEYKKFQNSCYYLYEKTRCWIVMCVAQLYSKNTERPSDYHWEDDFDDLDKAVTRYIPDSLLLWFENLMR